MSGGPARVVACPDGPLLVRGDVEVVDPDGRPVERHRRTVALCRCGATGIPPWCDGSHKVVGYRTPRPETPPAP
ncbi:CDGSH iron-sulfur domain-containing protein [Cellulomonas endophytica]|uniref:CDGSH iron-sulfur domain-containing protein n=1 Tax=Cellulomonas endophytica TaxID=2494735 RepID=UPI001010A288|nr:CDGSH iron-sulfur domain-containing protein [Cellulomonas endophytica]